jgi:hypothetical protein
MSEFHRMIIIFIRELKKRIKRSRKRDNEIKFWKDKLKN